MGLVCAVRSARLRMRRVCDQRPGISSVRRDRIEYVESRQGTFAPALATARRRAGAPPRYAKHFGIKFMCWLFLLIALRNVLYKAKNTPIDSAALDPRVSGPYYFSCL